MAEEPPYLSVDTDVSAKYKGAFCEAKIRKVVRSVKCKVLFKQGWGSATVPDDQIRGSLRIGAVVEAKHPDKKEFAEATITKIQDCSQYTVVFDDGDITTLRRTALCLKSGRHFAESDTLDQLPLTHPEHFSNPVIGGRRGRRRLDENSEDEELLLISNAELEDEREEHIGRVVCVEGSEKKKQKDNWFPGLVVAPTAQDNVPIHVKEEYLVRSFKDGRYYTVPKKEANEFTREVGARAEHPTLKAAVDKALLYLDRDELPPHWDRDLLLYGLGDINSTDNDGGLDYESSDDEPREEKDHFVAQLYKFMDDSGTPINKGPTVGTRDVDLYKLFKVVQNQGGYNRVTNHNNWKVVALKMGFGQNPITVNLVKIAYKKFLFTFEEFYRKLGCTLLNHPSRLSRSCCRGGRNLIRNKDQASVSSGAQSKNDTKARQVKDGKVVQGEMTVPVSKIKIEKVEEYINTPPEEEINDELPIEPGKSPTPPPLSQRDRPKRTHTSPHSPKIPLPIKIKLEPGTTVSNSTSCTQPAITCAQPTATSPVFPPSPSSSASTGFLPLNQPVSPATSQSVTPSSSQKKEPRARQLKKVQSVVTTDNVASANTSNVTKDTTGTVTIDQSLCAPPQLKEKKRRAAFPRAVVAAKKGKQQQPPPRMTSPHPPGLAASRTKRSVNKDKLRTIVKNLKSKWACSLTPTSSGQDQSSTKVAVKTKTKEDTLSNNIKNKKEEAQSQNTGCNDDKKKGGRKRRDKRLSEDRFVPLPSYKTILLGDKLRVYYGPTLESKVTYEAKVLSIRTEGNESVYLVHYTGWNNRYDEWIKTSRIADNLSWIPGRSARKTNQTPKTPKKKGGHNKNETVNGLKDASMAAITISPNHVAATVAPSAVTPTSTVSTTASSLPSSASLNVTTTGNKSTTVQPLLMSTSRKASTRASTRAAANKKDIPINDNGPDYESDTGEVDSVSSKKTTDSDILKSNDTTEKKKSRKRKLEEEEEEEEEDEEEEEEEEDEEEDEEEEEEEEEEEDLKEESSEEFKFGKFTEMTEVKMEDDDYENDGDDEEEENIEENSIPVKEEKPVKHEIEIKEESNSTNQLGNVIIVDVELKNESEEESLMIDETGEIDDAQVIEGYSSVVESDNNREDKFKVLTNQTGRDFDLTQIRSELKGIDTVSRPDEVEEGNVASTVDIYEFKEPEFETTKNDDKSKQRRSGIVVRMFSDVGQKENGDETESETNNSFDIAASAIEEPFSDDRPIIKTCEEAFDRVCAEPLRAATERPPAGFLFMGEGEDEDDIYDDDDSQDRLIISERDSDNDVPAEMSIDLTPAIEEQQVTEPTEASDTKTAPTLDAECTKEVLLSKDDDEEDLEDELLNVAIQRAIESSDDDGDLLSRHLAPRRMFTDNFGPVIESENKTHIDNNSDPLLKISVLQDNREVSEPKEEEIKEESGILQNSALDLSQTNDDIQERVEVITQEGEMVSEDEVVSQGEQEQETVIDALEIESNVGGDGDEGDEVEEDDLISVEEGPTSPSSLQVTTGRGPHTPPGPGPRTPPEPEPEDEYNEAYEQYEEVGGEEVWSNLENKELTNLEEANQGERDEPPPLLTREVEVEECDERQEEVEGNEDDNDETNLVSLLCEETIPGSPAVAVHTDTYQLSPEVNDDVSEVYSVVDVTKDEVELCTDKEEIQQKDSSADYETVEGSVSQAESVNASTVYRALPQRSQTPIPSPTSSLSSTTSPPRDRVESSPNEEVIQLQSTSGTCQNDQYQESCSVSQIQPSDEVTKPQAAVMESLRTRKNDARSSGKKTRRSRKRSEEVSKRKYRSRHHGSESDDNCESTSRGYRRRSRTPPRLRKYNFSVHLSLDMDHQQRVNKILNALSEVRKSYANVKMELASIERRRKKLRRREREFRI